MNGQDGADATSEIRCLDVAKRKGARRFVGVDGRRRDGGDGPQVDNAIDKAEDRTQAWMARAAVPDGFVTDAVLLAREREGGKSGCVEIGNGAVQVVQGPRSHPKGEISEAKKSIQGVIGRAHIFTWS